MRMMPRESKRRRFIVYFFLTSLFLVLTLQLIAFVDAYCVDIPYWDQWGFYGKLFRCGDLLELFVFQHGAHKQGLAFVITKFIGEYSNWNIRTEAFCMVGMLLVASVSMLYAKKRAVGRLALVDASILLLIITPTFYETIIQTPNASHGVFPLLLFCLYALVQTLGIHMRLTCTVLIGVSLLFTGFGLFGGLAILALHSFECISIVRAKQYMHIVLYYSSLVLLLAGLAWFASDYGQSAEPLSTAQVCDALKLLPVFIAYMLGFFCGFHVNAVHGILGPASLILGLALLSILIIVFVLTTRCLLRSAPDATPADRIAWVFLASTFLYVFITALGRAKLGAAGGQAFRYFPLITPAILGLHLYATRHPGPWPRVLVSLLLVGLTCKALVFSLPIAHITFPDMIARYDCKLRWKAAYLQTRDAGESNRIAGCSLGPPHIQNNIAAELNYMEQHNLGFFAREK